MRKAIIMIVCLLSCLQLAAQTKAISGKVIDSTGESVIGASVLEVGTTNGTITDIDGNFSLNVNPAGKIQISFIGYQTQVIEVKGKTIFNIQLKDDSELLEEVVITGYSGKQMRSKVTNSISKVKSETLSVGVYSNPAQALSGAVSGLKVTQSTGDPGATPKIVLRGGTNLDGSGDPLIIVDGQLRSNMSDINPEDIESMEVMKDAGATAIYGARASNGVILITTKSGKTGRAEVNFKARLGINYNNSTYDFLNARDYLTYMRKGVYNASNLFAKADGTMQGYTNTSSLSGNQPYGTDHTYGDIWSTMYKTSENEYLLGKGWQEMPDPVDPTKTLIFKDTDIASYNLNNPAITQDYNVNIAGGNDRGKYYVGLGYNNSEALPVTSYYKRYNFVLNASYKVTPWLESTSSVNYNRANWKSMPGSMGNVGQYFGRIMGVPSVARYEDEEGNLLLGPDASYGNQMYQADKWDIFNQSDKFTMTQSFQIDLMKGLFLKASASWYYSESLGENFTKDYETTPGNVDTSRYTSSSFARDFSQTYNAVLNYSNTFAKDHGVSALLGMEYYDLYTRGLSASGSGAPSDDFGDLELTDPGEGMRGTDSNHSQYRILSFFGRLNYDFKEKYLFSAVFRQDGYSSLLGDNRWGFFPGVSAGWLFGREDFVKNSVPFLSFGKLRASFGINGNASGIGPYDLQGSYTSYRGSGSSKTMLTYNGNTGFLINTLPNPNLRWEKTKTYEVGLDLSFLDNRLSTNFTYYNRLTSDKFASLTLPLTTGFSSILNNNGEIRNQGVEIEVSAKIVDKKDWGWDISGNISYNKNKIVSLPSNGQDKNRQNGQQVYTGKKLADGSYEKMWVGGYQEGQEPGVLVTYVAEGIYRSYDDIPADMIDKSTSKWLYGPGAWNGLADGDKNGNLRLPIQPGDVKWKDVNGDGIIDQYDQVKLGNTTPHWFGGFNTTFRWKNLSLYARFDYAFDYWIYDGMTPWFMGCMQGSYNTTKEVFDTWSESNQSAKYPRYLWGDQNGMRNYSRTSSLFAYKGNYLALKELSISYSLPKTWVSKAGMQQASLSVTGQNLGYLKSAKTMANPEFTQSGSAGDKGGVYGLPRTVLFGVNVTF